MAKKHEATIFLLTASVRKNFRLSQAIGLYPAEFLPFFATGVASLKSSAPFAVVLKGSLHANLWTPSMEPTVYTFVSTPTYIILYLYHIPLSIYIPYNHVM